MAAVGTESAAISVVTARDPVSIDRQAAYATVQYSFGRSTSRDQTNERG